MKDFVQMSQTYESYYKDYYQKNKERIKAYRRKRYEEGARGQCHEYYVQKRDEGSLLTYSREWKMWYQAKRRSEAKNLPFDLKLEDIKIPEVCPLLGIQLKKDYEGNRDHSPSLDRIIPEKGYTKDNVRVISDKANRMKSDITLEFAKALIKYLEE